MKRIEGWEKALVGAIKSCVEGTQVEMVFDLFEIKRVNRKMGFLTQAMNADVIFAGRIDALPGQRKYGLVKDFFLSGAWR